MLEHASHEQPKPSPFAGTGDGRTRLRPHALAACRRIAPLRGLKEWVAVNPWVGWSDHPIEQAMDEIRRVSGEAVLPSLGWFAERWKAGAFSEGHVERASARLGIDPAKVLAALEAPASTWLESSFMASEIHGKTEFLCSQAAEWCAKVNGGSPLPWKGGLFAIWRDAQGRDPEPEWNGLPGWRAWFANAPESVEEALSRVPASVGILGWNPEAWCLRLLAGVPGWASWLRGRGYVEQDLSSVLELLAIRVVQECAVAELLPPGAVGARRVAQEAPLVRRCLQDALEDAWFESMLAKLSAPAPRRGQPAVQAAFCIDVRSEPMRRALEAVDDGIRTAGFAGFFGLALRLVEHGSAVDLCPAPLAPRLRVTGRRLPAGPGLAWTRSGAANLPGVELAGWAALPAMARSLFGGRPKESPEPAGPAPRLESLDGKPLDTAAKTDLAQSLLGNLGFPIQARLVLLVGHRGSSANNPHAASLHCGACGGRGGAVNARMAAALLNDPDVRSELAWRGHFIPLSSVFAAAEHDTTLDEVRIVGRDQVPSSHLPDLERIEAALAKAGERVRRERAADLDLPAGPGRGILPLLRRRAADPAEVRPEWGLAANAAFVVAPRARTVGQNLSGRAFLHEYDPGSPDAAKTLGAILSAPVVVASWINLQYFASTIDPDRQGAGAKPWQNRVGDAGVAAGGSEDLRAGLSLESVRRADGTWRHEPLRLQVVVDDTRETVEEALRAHPAVAELVANGWIRLFALEGRRAWHRGPRDWELFGEA